MFETAAHSCCAAIAELAGAVPNPMDHKPSVPSSPIRLVTTCDEVHVAVVEARARGKVVGLVPTMGALHEGHLSLVRRAKQECSWTVVTIFVNPTQFGQHEDLGKYPRTLQEDLNALASCSVDLVFAPRDSEMYPPRFSTYVEPPDVANSLEGRCRPGHFRGVTTVVLKLFQLIPAHIAYFGQKDYQQLLVIRRMVEDLNLPITIRDCPTVREPDGLALSSRNVHLDADQRCQALALSRCLNLANDLVEQGERDTKVITDKMRSLLVDTGITRIDYVALVDPATLDDVPKVQGPTRALVAAFVGQTRLIDNRQIG